jgi:hypothetical protein
MALLSCLMEQTARNRLTGEKDYPAFTAKLRI